VQRSEDTELKQACLFSDISSLEHETFTFEVARSMYSCQHRRACQMVSCNLLVFIFLV
jgi:hypothetical protein